MTDKKATSENDNAHSNDSKAIASTTKKIPDETKTATNSARRKTASKPIKNNQLSPINKVSKLAILSMLIGLIATSGVVLNFFWQQQQNILLAEEITKRNTNTINNNRREISAILQQQKEDIFQSVQQVTQKLSEDNKKKIIDLSNSVNKLEKNITQQLPSDWLIHEVEYLIRIAARTMWLEQDTTAALGLLHDADARLKELNNPNFLPIRKLIHEDIKTLEFIPTLQTEEVILALMALSKQINTLPLILKNLGKEKEKTDEFELSNNTSDWQANLQKTWQNFLNDFITIRRRSNSIEALLSPEQQQNLRQNLSLKIQLAIWAASEQKSLIFSQSIEDILQWCHQYFDVEEVKTQYFIKAIKALEKQTISYQYSRNLSSLSAIKKLQKKEGVPAKIKKQSDVELKPQVESKKSEGSI